MLAARFAIVFAVSLSSVFADRGRARGASLLSARPVTLPSPPADVKLPPRPTTLPGDVVLVAVPSGTGKLLDGLEQLVRWPDEAFIHERLAREDRSAKFPPRFTKSGLVEAEGAVSPEEALDEAAAVARALIAEPFRPGNLRAAMLPLADPNLPQRSFVCARYIISGCAVQIIQLRSVVCLVVKPGVDVLGHPVTKLAPAQDGARLIKDIIGGVIVSGKSFPFALAPEDLVQPGAASAPATGNRFYAFRDEKTRGRLPDGAASPLIAASTDGHSVCLWFTRNGRLGGAHKWSPEEPWF